MRHTVTHRGEAADVLKKDIDPEASVIHIRPSALHSLKNDYKERNPPIIQPLADKLNA